VVQRSTAGAGAAGAAVVAWGLGNNIAKYARLPGPSLAFSRLWLGGAWFTLLLYGRGGRLTRRALRVAAPGGLAFGLDVLLFFTSLKHTSVADASIISCLQPALVLLAAGPLFGELVTLEDIALTAAATGGVVAAVLTSSAAAGGTFFGNALAAGSVLAWAWYFIASKQARQSLGTLEYQAALTVVAAVFVAPVILIQGGLLGPRDASTLGWVGLLVLIPGGGHLLMNWAHAHVPIIVTSILTLAMPVVATIGALIIFGEPVTWPQALSMAAVLASLGLVLVRHNRGTVGHPVRRPRPATA
jgi:drug/metabolite transporter (DMT)-like permease